MGDYPALNLLTRFGGLFAALFGFSIPVAASTVMVAFNVWNWVIFALACLAGVGVAFLMKVLGELTRVISDMLIPR